MKIPRASIWPTVTFNTTRPDEMAKAEAWVRSLVDGDPAACPVTAPEAPNSTQTPQEPNRTPQGDVVGTLLEAAASARTSTTYEAPSNWPPPGPGTHESDLVGSDEIINTGPCWTHRWEHTLCELDDCWDRGSVNESHNASDWSTANRKDDPTDIDLEPAIGRNFDYIARPKENK